MIYEAPGFENFKVNILNQICKQTWHMYIQREYEHSIKNIIIKIHFQMLLYPYS